VISDATPIHLNQVLNIYLAGMGAVTSPVNAGDASPGSPLAATQTTPAITIGGASIFTLWSGLAPGLVGIYQINAQVPFHHIPTGSSIPLTITQGGASTTVNVRVEE
jgi:minor extracellular serine protease Vpr